MISYRRNLSLVREEILLIPQQHSIRQTREGHIHVVEIRCAQVFSQYVPFSGRCASGGAHAVLAEKLGVVANLFLDL
jgi:hypothetical protein